VANDDPDDDYWPDFMDWSGDQGKVRPDGSHSSTAAPQPVHLVWRMGLGDTGPLPYLTVEDMATALERVRELGGSIIHPGERWAICRDSEGSPFALAAPPAGRGVVQVPRRGARPAGQGSPSAAQRRRPFSGRRGHRTHLRGRQPRRDLRRIVIFHEPLGSGPLGIGACLLAFCLVIAGAALMPAPMRAIPDAG
jgi:hypothetical protein